MSKFEILLNHYKTRLSFLKELDEHNLADYSFELSREDIERMRKNNDYESLEGVIEDDLEVEIRLLEKDKIFDEEDDLQDDLFQKETFDI
jgi:stage III sporulation protein SpoIIIAA